MTQAPELPTRSIGVKSIEIFAPDRRSTELLHPPTGGGRVVDFLSLVQRWLEIARLPWANIVYDGRRYLIRPSAEIVQSA